MRTSGQCKLDHRKLKRRNRLSTRLGLESLEDRFLLAGDVPAAADLPQLHLTVGITTDEVDEDRSEQDLSLREAVLEANAYAGDVTIRVPHGEYELSLTGRSENDSLRGDIDITNTNGVVRFEGVSSWHSNLPEQTLISGMRADRVFDIHEGANVELTRLLISEGWASGSNPHGGAIRNAGSLALDVVEVARNVVDGRGAGIYSLGDLSVTRSLVRENQADGDGGGIYSHQPLTVRASDITENLSLGAGGGVFIFGDGDDLGVDAIIEHSDIYDNESATNGGGVSLDAGRLRIEQSELFRNEARSSGGGLYSNDSFFVDILNTEFIANVAADQGGAISLRNGHLSVENSEFGENHAISGGALHAHDANVRSVNDAYEFNHASNGGAVLIDGDDSIGDQRSLTVEFIESVFLENEAFSGSGQGGGLLVTRTAATVEAADFIRNTAHTGGAVFSDVQLDVTSSDFAGNMASANGGGIANTGIAVVRTSEFTSNDAGENGGGIHTAGGSLEINNSELRRGKAALLGGGVYGVGSNVDVSGSRLVQNEAQIGGGLFLEGRSGGAADFVDVRLTDSEIFGNRASMDNGNGGGMALDLARMRASVEDAIVRENEAENGGGISYFDGQLTVLRSRIENNIAVQNGGGIVGRGDGELMVADSTVRANQAEYGGGFSIGEDDSTTVVRSTVSDNVTTGGTGGAFNVEREYELNILSSTISGNSAFGFGGAIFVGDDGDLNLENSTVTNNVVHADELFRGGGLYSDDDSFVHVRHTILSGNYSAPVNSLRPTAPDDLAGILDGSSTFSHNLIGPLETDMRILVLTSGEGNKIRVTDPGLSPLADNGGPTKTHLPRFDSPALNAGNPSPFATWSPDEQRGFERFVSVIDIGSVEVGLDELQQPLQDETFYLTNERTTAWLKSYLDPEFNVYGAHAEWIGNELFVGYWPADSSHSDGRHLTVDVYELGVDGQLEQTTRLQRPFQRGTQFRYSFAPNVIAMVEELPDELANIYTFRRGPSGWHRSATVAAVPETMNGQFGGIRALTDDVLVVSVATDFDKDFSARVYEWQNRDWQFVSTLEAPDDDVAVHHIMDLDVDGQRIAVGWQGFFDPNSFTGVRTYERSNIGWELTGSVETEANELTFDLSGDQLIAAGIQNDPAHGATIFKWNGNEWQQDATLEVVDDPAEHWDDVESGSVAIQGGVALVGMDHDDDPGAVYVFHRVAGEWIQTERLLSRTPPNQEDNFFSVSIDGGHFAIGDNDTNEILLYGVSDLPDGRRVLRVGDRGVLQNDVVAQEISASLLTQSMQGIVTVLPNGEFHYVPNEDLAKNELGGQDAFEYLGHRDELVSGIGTTTIIVEPDDPVVIEVIRNGENGSYAEMTSIGFRFSDDLSGAIQHADLRINNDTQGEAVSLRDTQMTYGQDTDVATWNMVRLELSPGRYTATLDLREAGTGRDFISAEFIVTFRGDANLDGAVDGSDFNIWLENRFASGTDWLSGDFNLDGNTDADDLDLWRTFRFQSIDQDANANIANRPLILRRNASHRTPRAALVAKRECQVHKTDLDNRDSIPTPDLSRRPLKHSYRSNRVSNSRVALPTSDLNQLVDEVLAGWYRRV